jgi:hypothetical protein
MQSKEDRIKLAKYDWETHRRIRNGNISWLLEEVYNLYCSNEKTNESSTWVHFKTHNQRNHDERGTNE